jgi:filamin
MSVDARDAGDGDMEISVTGPSGRSVQNTISQLAPGRFEVVFVPSECGQHYVGVTFNKENVPGSRFTFLVIDPGNATVAGDGLGFIRCNQPTTFTVVAPGAQSSNIAVKITGQLKITAIDKLLTCCHAVSSINGFVNFKRQKIYILQLDGNRDNR